MAGDSRAKQARELCRAVKAAGGSTERTQEGHLRVTGPAGSAVVGADLYGRALHNARTQIRALAGLDIRPRPGRKP